MSKLKKALDKAAQSRINVPLFSTKTTGQESAAFSARDKGQASRANQDADENKEIVVEYTQTKIQKADYEVLKKNKVISMSKGNDFANQIEFMRAKILNKLKEINGNTILVTSSLPGEGKTFTSINLGISIAQELNRTVAIVDADLRHPWKYHRDFASDFWGIKFEKGLADYLLGEAEIKDIIVNPGIDKLILLPGGKQLANSSELLGSIKMRNLVMDLKNRYGKNRVVIIDSPSMLTCSDPLVFTDIVDGIILVVESGRTKTDEINSVLKTLDSDKILGIILNKSRGKKNYYI